MSYNTHNFQTGAVLTAAQLNEMDAQIVANETALTSKQDVLVFDTTPTAGSTNPVTSDGVRAYVDVNKFSDAERQALLALLTQSVALIPQIGYITADNNGMSTAAAAQAAITALGGTVPWIITRVLVDCELSNSTDIVTNGSSYIGTLSLAEGYYLSAVTVTMGGVDITSTAYDSGTKTISIASVTGNVTVAAHANIIRYDITKNLTECTLSSSTPTVPYHGFYEVTIATTYGYGLKTVTVIMNGVDVTSTVYTAETKNIKITSATGPITITAVAEKIVYTLTRNLTNCTYSRAGDTINYRAACSGTLYVTSGYTLDSIVVTMGGTDVTATAWHSDTNYLSIYPVTGDVVITAVASLHDEAPDPVASVAATLQSDKIVVSWEASAGATHYALERQVNGGAWTTVDGNISVTSYEDADVTGGSSYSYRVSACNTSGSSTATQSNTVNIKALEAISAVYNGAGHTVYAGDSLDTLKPYLTVTASYNDSTTATVSGYTLSGDLASAGTKTVTVSYGGKTTTFSVTVESVPSTLDSISVALNLGSHVVKEGDSLDTLKAYLTVTAHYSDSTTATVSDYTLSGDLTTTGTKTVTVSYQSKTDDVTVHVYNTLTVDKVTLPSGYTQVERISSSGSGQYINLGVQRSAVDHVAYGVRPKSPINPSTNWEVLASKYTSWPYFRCGKSGGMTFQGRISSDKVAEIPVNWETETNYAVEAYTISDGTATAVINGTVASAPTPGSLTDDTNIFLYARNENGTPQSLASLHIFYVRLYDGQNNLIHNYVPCKNSNDVAGLYDTVAEAFLPSSATAALIAGEVLV